jgi:hypothetical protein
VASAGNFPVYDWESLCDGHGFVTAVDGVWNERNGDRLDPPGGFTLACMTGAIGKCLDIYHAWESDDLRDTHQACTRMVRADYCGNGTAYTHDGTPIDVEDELGIETLDSTPFELEAHWTPDGAHCVGSGRYNYFILPAYPTEEESTPSPIDSCPDRFTACENLPASVAPGSAGDPSLLTSHADPEKWPWSSTPQYSIDWCE